MTSPAWAEVQTAVGGTLRLACGDRQALGVFDSTLDGFWRSFRAAIVCYPPYLMLQAFRVTPAQWAAAGIPRIVIVETVAYVILWPAFALLILQLTRWLDREQRFLSFMVIYNWSQIPQTALIAIVALDRATGVFPPATARFAELAATIAVLVYEWYIARLVLAVTGPQAALVVVFELLLATAVGRVTLSLYQPSLF